MKRRCIKKVALFVVLACVHMASGCSEQGNIAAGKGISGWKTVIPFEYDSISAYPNDTFVKVEKNKKYGLFQKIDNQTFQQFIEPDYDKIEVSSDNNYVFLTKEGKTRICNNQKIELTEQPFLKVWDFAKIDAFAVETEEETWGFLSQNGSWIIPPKYKSLYPLNEGEYFLVTLEGGEYDVVESDGNSIIPPGITVHFAEKDYPYIYTVDRMTIKYGVIDYFGNTVVPTEYDLIEFTPPLEAANMQGCFLCRSDDKTITVRDEKGNIILKNLPYQMVERYGQDRYRVKNENKYGVIAKDGSIVIPIEYDATYSLSYYKNYLLIKNNEAYVSDPSGKITPVSIDIDKIPSYYQHDMLRFVKDKKYGCINLEGEEIIPPVYEFVDLEFCEELLLAEKDGKFGYIDRNNQIKIPFEYTYASSFKSGFAEVVKDGKLGIISTTGEVVVPFQFDPPFPSSDKNVIVAMETTPAYVEKQNGKYGYVIIQS